MKRIFLTFLLLGAGSVLLAQSITIQRGPFDLGSGGLPSVIYGADDRILMSSNGGVWYTDDRESWIQPAGQDPGLTNITGLLKDDDGNLYAISSTNIFKSTDNGDNWNFISYTMLDGVTQQPIFAPTNCYAISNDTLFVGLNNGLGYNVEGQFLGVYLHEFAGKNIVAIAVDGNHVIAIDDTNMMHFSLDRGATWDSSQLTFNYETYSHLAIKGSKIIITNQDIWYTENWGDDWTKKEDGFTGTPIDLKVANDKFYGVGLLPYVFSEDDDEWQAVDAFQALVIAVSGDHMFTAGQGGNAMEQGRLRETIDGGDNWDAVPINGYTSGTIFDMKLDADSNIYAVNDLELYKKAKGASVFERFIPNAFASLLIDGDFIYAATYGGVGKYDRATGDLIESNDVDAGAGSGAVNEMVKSGDNIFADKIGSGVRRLESDGHGTAFNTGLPGTTVTQLQADGGNLYVLCNGSLYKTPDDAPNWQKFTIAELDGQFVYHLLVHETTIIITAQPGVISHDGGATWKPLKLENYALALSYANGVYYSGTGSFINASYDNGDTWHSKKISTQRPVIIFAALPTKDSIYFSTIGDGIWSFRKLKFQSIDFEVTDHVVDEAPFDLTENTSEGLPINYSTTTDRVSISGNTITILKPGPVDMMAVQNGNNKTDAAVSITKYFCIDPKKPTITKSVEGETVILTSDNDTGNQWYFGDDAIEDATGKTLEITEEGDYTVQTTIESCASETSEIFNYVIETPEEPGEVTGLGEDISSAIRMYPNPANDEINLVTSRESTIELLDLYGSTIESRTSAANKAERFNVRSLASGFYLFKVRSNDGLTTMKFLKH